MNHPKWVLAEAIQAILASGVTPTELSNELGFSDTSMIYRYSKGTTLKTSAIRASILFTTYDMLLDDYDSEEHLNMLLQQELDKGGRMPEPCAKLMDRLLILASYKGADLRTRLLRFIADYDKRL